jgi:D-glycero-D-manno-heptose 1,7-bisphosphate phosphatase
MVGDLISDVLAGLNAGCRSILVHSGQTTAAQGMVPPLAGRSLVAADLAAAVDLILDVRPLPRSDEVRDDQPRHSDR